MILSGRIVGTLRAIAMVSGATSASMFFATTSPVVAQTFMGYDCTEDCSGHEAGYSWAEDKGITDPYDCSGNSRSFIEGCEAYANANGGYENDESSSAEDEENQEDADETD